MDVTILTKREWVTHNDVEKELKHQPKWDSFQVGMAASTFEIKCCNPPH
jgi:hypothetical protein